MRDAMEDKIINELLAFASELDNKFTERNFDYYINRYSHARELFSVVVDLPYNDEDKYKIFEMYDELKQRALEGQRAVDLMKAKGYSGDWISTALGNKHSLSMKRWLPLAKALPQYDLFGEYRLKSQLEVGSQRFEREYQNFEMPLDVEEFIEERVGSFEFEEVTFHNTLSQLTMPEDEQLLSNPAIDWGNTLNDDNKKIFLHKIREAEINYNLQLGGYRDYKEVFKHNKVGTKVEQALIDLSVENRVRACRLRDALKPRLLGKIKEKIEFRFLIDMDDFFKGEPMEIMFDAGKVSQYTKDMLESDDYLEYVYKKINEYVDLYTLF